MNSLISWTVEIWVIIRGVEVDIPIYFTVSIGMNVVTIFTTQISSINHVVFVWNFYDLAISLQFDTIKWMSVCVSWKHMINQLIIYFNKTLSTRFPFIVQLLAACKVLLNANGFHMLSKFYMGILVINIYCIRCIYGGIKLLMRFITVYNVSNNLC